MTVRRNLFQNFAAVLSASSLERVLLAVIVMLVARNVGPTEFGAYAASFALTRILAIIFSLGLDAWLLRNGLREGDYGQLRMLSTTCLTIKFSLGALWVLAMIGLSSFLNPEVFPPAFILLCSLTILFEETANTVWSAARAALRNQQILKFFVTGQVLLLATVAVLGYRGTDSALAYLLAQMMLTGLIAVIALVWQARTLGFSLDLYSLLPTLRGTLVFGASAGLAMIYGRADVALVAHFLGSQAAGFYSPAVSIMSALVLVPMAAHLVTVPALSRKYEENPASVPALARRLILVSIPIGVIAILVLAFSADTVVRILLGSKFAETGELLTVLSGVLGARFITLAAVGLNLLIIPRWGIMGAAGTFVLTEWLLVGGYLNLVKRWGNRFRLETPMVGT
jgi:O-antigen/teichoic acid export membrane protein